MYQIEKIPYAGVASVKLNEARFLGRYLYGINKFDKDGKDTLANKLSNNIETHIDGNKGANDSLSCRDEANIKNVFTGEKPSTTRSEIINYSVSHRKKEMLKNFLSSRDTTKTLPISCHNRIKSPLDKQNNAKIYNGLSSNNFKVEETSSCKELTNQDMYPDARNCSSNIFNNKFVKEFSLFSRKKKINAPWTQTAITLCNIPPKQHRTCLKKIEEEIDEREEVQGERKGTQKEIEKTQKKKEETQIQQHHDNYNTERIYPDNHNQQDSKNFQNIKNQEEKKIQENDVNNTNNILFEQKHIKCDDEEIKQNYDTDDEYLNCQTIKDKYYTKNSILKRGPTRPSSVPKLDLTSLTKEYIS